MELEQCNEQNVKVPADVSAEMRQVYIKNFLTVTKNTGRLYLFAGDQKIEHLNDDFYGTTDIGQIPLDDADPEHMFKIAANSCVGCFATQLGLIARYARDYPSVPYLVKLNSKSHLVKTEQKDPCSRQMVTMEQVLRLQKQGLNIVGVGYTVYTGSEFEDEMVAEAARVATDAHHHGLLAVFWMYPRGKAVKDEKDPHLIAGAAGMGACLGADFVKVNYPKQEGHKSEEVFKEAILSAGRTRVITSGGSSTDVRKFLEQLYKQIHVSGAKGNATGRNVHQKDLQGAIKMSNAIAAITYDNQDVDYAMRVYSGEIEVK